MRLCAYDLDGYFLNFRKKKQKKGLEEVKSEKERNCPHILELVGTVLSHGTYTSQNTNIR